MKTNSPSSDEPLAPIQSLTYFSNNRNVSIKEFSLAHLASLTSFREGEPKALTKARRRFEIAERTVRHLQDSNLYAVLDSFDFIGLSMKGKK